ncbi:MAG: translocation/assembly module TamB domain-containing protein [Deltaproteobacteria bacterium]|nr:translocation/assembly module TamB domain-containing protein [Deltaproteobacteria bacterium]
MFSWTKILRFGALAFAGLVVVGCVLLLSAYAILQTDAGRASLVGFVNKKLSTPGGTEIRIHRLDGDLLRHLEIKGLAVRDKDGEWFRLSTVQIEWRLAALFDGVFHITHLNLTGLHMTRVPVQENERSPATFHWPSLPLRIAIDRFSLEGASLAKPVFGEPVVFRAYSSTTVDPHGLVHTKVDVDRTDGVPGHARIEAEFQPQSNRLGIQFALNEPPGGTLARVLNLTGLPSLSIDAIGDGPLDDWHGVLQIRAGDIASLDMKLALDVVNQSTLKVEGHADVSRFFHEPLRSLLVAGLTFDAAVDFTNEGVVLRRVYLANELGTVGVSGEIKGRDGDLNVALTCTPRGIDYVNGYVTPLSIGGIRVDVKLEGPLQQPFISVDVVTDSPVLDTVSAGRFKGVFEIDFQRSYNQPDANPSIRAKGHLTGVRLEPPELHALLGEVINWSFDSTLHLDTKVIDIRDAVISTAFGRLSGSGQVAMGRQESDLRVTVEINDLALLSPVIHRPVAGTAKVESLIHSSDFRQGMAASLTGKLNGLSLGDMVIDKLLGSQVSVAGNLVLRTNDEWAIRDLTIESAVGTLSGGLSITQDSHDLEGHYRMRVPRLADLSDIAKVSLAGQLDMEGDIGGTLADPSLSGKISLQALAMDGIDLSTLEAQLEAALRAEKPHGHISMSLRNGKFGDARSATNFAYIDTAEIELNDLVVEFRDTKLTGGLMVPLKGGPVTGSLAGRLSSLAAWSDWAGRKVSGKATFALHLSTEGESQNAELTLDGNDLAVAVGVDKKVELNTINVSARVKDLLGIPKGRVEFVAQDVKLFDALLSTLSFRGDIDGLNRVTVRAGGKGDLQGPFELDLTGEYSRDGQGIELMLSGLDALVMGQTIEIEKAALFTLGPDRMAVADLVLAVGDGRVSASGRITGDGIEGALEVTNLPLALAEIAIPDAGVTGTFSGHARISVSRTSPSGRFTLEIADMRQVTAMVRDAPSIAGRVEGEWRDGRLHLAGELSDLVETNVSLEADLPLLIEPMSLAVQLPQKEPIDGKMTWRGELEPIWNLLTTGEDRFTGRGDLALDLGGTLDALHVSGHFDLTRGQYQNIITGTTFSNVEMRLEGDRDRLVFKKLVADDGSDGRLQGDGALDLDPAKHFPMNVQVEFKETILIARDDLTVRASGNMAFKGSLRKALLSGKVVTGDVELNLGHSPAPEIVELDIEEINLPDGPPKENQSAAGGGPGPGFVDLDLQISVPGKAFVRGMGLDSEWKGDLKITGTADAPIVAGVLEPVRGQFILMGKTFELKNGSVRFAGTRDIDPILNLAAEYKATGLTAIVALTGSASQPKIELTSRPPMTQSEIAARVLFGTDAEGLTPAQSIQLASSIATLSGMGAAGGIMDTTRSTLGVDVLKFGEAEHDPTEITVSVGKYVAEGVYIELERGTKGDSRTSTTIELEVLPNVRVEGGTTQKGGSKVGLKWKWDY